MRVRQLTQQGMDLFREFIDKSRNCSDIPVPFDFLYDQATSEPFHHSVQISVEDISTRLKAGRLMYRLFGGLNDPGLDQNEGLWAWLSLFYFDQLCPKNGGKRKISRTETLIPDTSNHQRYYRHLLAGPYFVYRIFYDRPEDAMALLCQPVETPGAVVEELVSRQELVTNRDFIAMCTRLFYSADSGTLKKGSGGKGAGSARRLAKNMVDQFEVTWDLQSVGVDGLLELLPDEFSKFKN